MAKSTQRHGYLVEAQIHGFASKIQIKLIPVSVEVTRLERDYGRFAIYSRDAKAQ